MRRAMLHCLLVGLVTGLVAGIARFGLPMSPEDAPAGLAALTQPLGLGLDHLAVAAGSLVLALLALLARADLRRVARVRRF